MKIDSFVKKLEDKFGKNILVQADKLKAKKIERIPTGNLSLDIDLGGGFPKTRMIEIYGPESSGKTFVALKTASVVTSQGRKVGWIDAEGVWDNDWAKIIGVDISKVFIGTGETAEENLDLLEALVLSNEFDLIVVDSVAALIPKEEQEKSTEDWQMGLAARLMNKALRKLHSALNSYIREKKSGPAVIFINQLRQKIGMVFGNPNVTTGGKGLKYATSVRLELALSEYKKEDDYVVKQITKYVTKKNKTAPPNRIGEFGFFVDDSYYGAKGEFDNILDLIEWAEYLELIEKQGSWYVLDKYAKKKFQLKSLREELSKNNQLRKKIFTDLVKILNIELDFKNYVWNEVGD